MKSLHKIVLNNMPNDIYDIYLWCDNKLIYHIEFNKSIVINKQSLKYPGMQWWVQTIDNDIKCERCRIVLLTRNNMMIVNSYFVLKDTPENIKNYIQTTMYSNIKEY